MIKWRFEEERSRKHTLRLCPQLNSSRGPVAPFGGGGGINTRRNERFRTQIRASHGAVAFWRPALPHALLPPGPGFDGKLLDRGFRTELLVDNFVI